MSNEKPIKGIVTKNLGRYNLCSNEKQWCVQVLMPDGKWLSETWDESDEPHVDGLPPSEVIDLIVDRINSYWISGRRKEQLEMVEKHRESFDKMDDAWARSQIASLERRIESLKSYVMEEV